MCEPHFVKADSSNLPEVDLIMIMEFFNENHDYISAEIRGAKMDRSSRDTYGDNAIGYVQLYRTNDKCIMFARITPEHKINSKYYKVGCTILEREKKIEEVKCYDCSASEGGCKHGIAFVVWLHRRSEEPSPTETICYWKRSILSGITTTKRFITTSDFGRTSNVGNFHALSDYIVEAKRRRIKNSTMRYHYVENYQKVSIYWLKSDFISQYDDRQITYLNFKTFCEKYMLDSILKEIEKNARDQSKSKIWDEMRYGRVTASKAYEAVNCVTHNGVLVENILGAKFFETKAMKRGLAMEEEVLKSLSIQTQKSFKKAGIFLSAECPIVGASPDAISDDSVVEIKSPFLKRTVKNYIDEKGEIMPKFYHQIQMQMYLTKKQKAIFVVADPEFEKNKKIVYKIYDYDSDFTAGMLKKIIDFWMNAVINKI